MVQRHHGTVCRPGTSVGSLGRRRCECGPSTGRTAPGVGFYVVLQFSYPDTMMGEDARLDADTMPGIAPGGGRGRFLAADLCVLTLDERVGTALSPAIQCNARGGICDCRRSSPPSACTACCRSHCLHAFGNRRAPRAGAAPTRIVRFILVEGLRLGLIGVAIGLFAAIAAGRLTAASSSTSARSRILAGVTVVALAVAGLAAFIRRGARRRSNRGAPAD